MYRQRHSVLTGSLGICEPHPSRTRKKPCCRLPKHIQERSNASGLEIDWYFVPEARTHKARHVGGRQGSYLAV